MHPDIEIELLADSLARNMLTREIDISISLSRPKKGKLMAWKLAGYELKLYASKKYLENNNKINSLKDLNDHKFISYIDDLIDFPELKYLNDLNKNMKVVFRSNSLRAQFNAVKKGIGLALLHTFIAKEEEKLEIILNDQIKISREYWIVVHEDLIKLKRVRVVIDFFSQIIKKDNNNFFVD
jgi:DNA-binding transcriptional LysR family regulator